MHWKWKADATVTEDDGVGVNMAINPASTASSMQQIRGLPSLSPVHTAECWSMVYFLYTHAAPHCHQRETLTSSLPAPCSAL